MASRRMLTYLMPREVFKRFCTIPTEEPCRYLASYVNQNGNVEVFCNRQLLSQERCTSIEAIILRESDEALKK